MARSRVKIKDEIMEELEKYEKTTHGVARAVNCHYNTAERNLEELEDRGAVSRHERDEKTYWRLNK